MERLSFFGSFFFIINHDNLEHIGKEAALDDNYELYETGEVEPRLFYVSEPKLYDYVRATLEHYHITKSMIALVPVGQGLDHEYVFRQDEVISDAYYWNESGAPVVSMVCGEQYLFHISDKPDRIPIEELKPVGMAFAEIAAKAAEILLLQAGEELEVNLQINAVIDTNGRSHYVHGEIPGRNPQRFILVGGHYDAYWDGFQDNATSLGSLMTIAKAMIDMGYEPEGTLVFLINGAEEYGKTGCYYDFAHSVRHVLQQHPEWANGAIGYNNFELTAHCETGSFVAVSAHGYAGILDQWLNEMDFLNEPSVFPDPSVQADDVVFSKSGVPSFMNVYMIEAEGPDSFELFDHTAWDNVDRFNADVFAENNKAFGLLDMKLDQMPAAPLNLSEITQACQSEEGYELLAELYPDFRQWEAGLQKLEETAAQMYDTVCGLNAKAANCRGFFADRKRKKCYDEGWECTKAVLAANRMLQQDVLKYDAFMTLIFGHRQPCAYVAAIDALIEELAAGQAGQALEALCGLDNNYLIAEFDKEVYQKVALDAFTPERTAGSWGEGQTMPFPDLQDVLLSIMEKTEADQAGSADFAEEIKMLQAVREEQYGILAETMEKESAVFRKAAELLQPHVSKKAAKKKKAEADGTQSINSKVKDLLKSPEAVEIIERHAPGATSNPDLKWVMNMKLKNVAPISDGMLTSEMLEAIDIDLKKL